MPAAGPRKVPPDAPLPEQVAVPPFYEATEDIYYGTDPSVMPVAAFRKGDRVPPDLVDQNGWGGKVKVPDRYAGILRSPVPGEPAANPAGKE